MNLLNHYFQYLDVDCVSSNVARFRIEPAHTCGPFARNQLRNHDGIFLNESKGK